MCTVWSDIHIILFCFVFFITRKKEHVRMHKVPLIDSRQKEKKEPCATGGALGCAPLYTTHTIDKPYCKSIEKYFPNGIPKGSEGKRKHISINCVRFWERKMSASPLNNTTLSFVWRGVCCCRRRPLLLLLLLL